jgi:hypothetical protein
VLDHIPSSHPFSVHVARDREEGTLARNNHNYIFF